MRKLLVVLVLLGCTETSRVLYMKPPGIRDPEWKDCIGRVQALLDAHPAKLEKLTELQFECLRREFLHTCGVWRLVMFDNRRGVAKDMAIDAFRDGMQALEANVCDPIHKQSPSYDAAFSFFWDRAIEEWVENPAERDALQQCMPRKAG